MLCEAIALPFLQTGGLQDFCVESVDITRLDGSIHVLIGLSRLGVGLRNEALARLQPSLGGGS